MKKPYAHAFLPLLLLMMVVGQPVLAQEATDDAPPRWTPELSMQYKGVGQTALSPDGSLVAYRIREPLMEGEKSEYRSHIWVASTDGTTNYQYTQGEASTSSPASPPPANTWLSSLIDPRKIRSGSFASEAARPSKSPTPRQA